MNPARALVQKKVCMLGSFAVGKTSLVRRVAEGRFAERYLTTVGVRIERLDVTSDVGAMRLLLWDIAGDDDFASVRESYLRGASGYALVVDAGRRATLETAVTLHERVRRVCGDIPFVLLVNKADLPHHDVDRETLSNLTADGWRIRDVSARTGEGAEAAFAELADAMLVRPRAPTNRESGARLPLDGPRGDQADGELALQVLTSLDTMILAPRASGGFRIIGRPPAWASGGVHPLSQQCSAFLTAFVDEARARWTSDDGGAGWTSGPFREGDGPTIEATAVRVAGRPLLVVRRLGVEHDDQVAMLQRARENLLEQDRLEVEVRRRTRDIRRREEEIALRLVSAAESRDGSTGAHVRRIGLYSAVLARALGWSEQMIDDLRMAAPMHDIGKLAIPDSILLKPGPLTPGQWTVVRTHTTIGAAILEDSDVPLLQMACAIALCHHERWDGTGYPGGRAGHDIPEAARIVAVTDVYDALVNERPYKAAMPEADALAEMTSERGTHFDPDVFDAFLRELPHIRELRRAVGESSALGAMP